MDSDPAWHSIGVELSVRLLGFEPIPGAVSDRFWAGYYQTGGRGL